MKGMKKEKKVPTTECKQRVFLVPSDEIENHVTGPESLLWMNELWEMFPSDNHRRGKDQHATTTDVMKAKPKSEEEDLEGMITKDSLVPAFEGLAIAGTASKVATGVEGKDGEGTTTTPAPPLNAAGLKLGALHDSRPEGQATSSQSRIDGNATSMQIIETTRYSIISLCPHHPSAEDESQAVCLPLDLAEERLVEESIGKE